MFILSPLISWNPISSFLILSLLSPLFNAIVVLCAAYQRTCCRPFDQSDALWIGAVCMVFLVVAAQWRCWCRAQWCIPCHSNPLQTESCWGKISRNRPLARTPLDNSRARGSRLANRPERGPQLAVISCCCRAASSSASGWVRAARLLTDEELAAMFCRMFAVKAGSVLIVLNADVPDRALRLHFRQPAQP